MKINLFGPATITHDGTDIGKTNGGGSVTILEQSYEPLKDTYDRVHKPYGLEGQINLFQLTQSVTISSDLTLYGFGEVVISLTYGTLTLYSAKLLLPESLSFGTFDQNPFTLRIIGGKDSSGNLINFS